MSKKKSTSPRGRMKEAAQRKFKKKTSPLVIEKVEYVDYKDVDLLQRFMSDRAKIRNRRVSGNDVQQQREVAKAIKNAREMALLPYTKRVAAAGRPRRDDRRGPAEAAPGAADERVEEITDEIVDEVIDEIRDEMADEAGED